MGNLVMEQLLPSLETELLPRLKAKKTERKRVWFAVSGGGGARRGGEDLSHTLIGCSLSLPPPPIPRLQTVEAAYLLAQQRLLEGLSALKEECSSCDRQQEVLMLSDMDQIVATRRRLEEAVRGSGQSPPTNHSQGKQQWLALSRLRGQQTLRQRYSIE